ncbi:ribosome small subunit-dependent GTPase A [Sporomusa aerivorans]|uniref:ribosome small subunit-dependent GTPase A n=1 Tax=Sporomusa aerivorans TaxID=204936 RepID=UPI00352B35D3
MTNINLADYGLNPRFRQEAELYEGMYLARVCSQHRELYKLVGECGEFAAVVSGRLAHNASNSTEFPAVGDWVMVDRANDYAGNAVILHVLQRKSMFARKSAGTSHSLQIVAANIDVIFICMSLNADFSLRRLERYLSIAWDSMAIPVIVLTKADLCNDLKARLADIATVSGGTNVVVCSGMTESGCQAILSHITPGKTIAFIGSSGVGKSTLINRLLGQTVLSTREIREDDKGRHTTTHRQLLLLPGGGIVIDTPGMRELQLDSVNLAKAFADIEDLAANCKYRDCSHATEPGCAVRNAINTGELPEERLESYKKLLKEACYAGLNSRQLEQEKIKNMFGGLGEMKQVMRYAKNKKKR